MIKVECFTNLDKYDGVKWPERMCCRPIKGDFVEGKRKGRGYDTRPVLRVIDITHCNGHLKVELHN